MNVVLLGGTKGIGRALARRLAARGDRIVLLGRDPADLERSARDLEIRAGLAASSIAVAHADLDDPATFVPALDAARASLGTIDTVVVTAADFATQTALEADAERLRHLLVVNFAHTILFCEAARVRLRPSGGTLCVVSSIAGDRGRKPVILYGATKAGLSHYLEGLDHKFRREGLRVVCIRPGFVKTGMTTGLPVPPFAAEPDAVARDVVKAIDRGSPVVYSPPIWRLVSVVIRCLPRFVMRRIGF